MTPYYQAPGVTLYHGRAEDVLPTLEPVDLTVTSPPYDNLRTYNGYTFDFETIAKELYRVTKPGGVVVWVVGDATIDGSETGTSFRQALYLKSLGFSLETMIWQKTGSGCFGSNYFYAQNFDFMFVCCRGTPKISNLIRDRKNVRTGKGVVNGSIDAKGKSAKRTIERLSYGIRANVWHISPDISTLQNSLHPAPFPESLANDHIRSWSNPGNTILDPMMGSGTTGKMARKNGCNFIGIDISEEYCELTAKRLSQEVLQFAATGD